MSWPIPLPAWFWPWVRWRRGVGEFAPYGPANPSMRPKSAPARISAWAWARLKLNIAGSASSSYSGLLRTNGLWLRNPRGGVEDVAEMRAAGFTWIALNVGDFALAEWTTVIERADAVGVGCIPWRRVRTQADVAALARDGTALDARALGVNLEKEADLGTLKPADCAAVLHSLWSREVITITEPWLYNAVDWRALAALGPACLEIFPLEAESARDPKGCVAHAHEMGFRDVFPCYGTYAGATPAMYDLRQPHSLYTGDDVGAGNFKTWAAA